MKNLKTLAAVAALAALAATNAYADAPRYDFLDLSYQDISQSYASFYSSDHAYSLSGSYEFSGNWIGGASYEHESAESQGARSTIGNSYEAGIGYRFAMTDSLDLVPHLSYAHSQFEGAIASNNISDSGYVAGLLLRAMVTEAVELQASIDHTTPISAANTLGIGVRYNFTPTIALGLGYSYTHSTAQNNFIWPGAQKTHSFSVGLRYYFK